MSVTAPTLTASTGARRGARSLRQTTVAVGVAAAIIVPVLARHADR